MRNNSAEKVRGVGHEKQFREKVRGVEHEKQFSREDEERLT